jgi:hypothetical protein
MRRITEAGTPGAKRTTEASNYDFGKSANNTDEWARSQKSERSSFTSTDFSSVQAFLSGIEIFQKSHRKFLILFSQQLCNTDLEQLFFGLWSDSAVNSTVTLSSAFAAHSRLYSQSVSDVSLLSVDGWSALE